MEKQTTILNKVVFSGKALQTGKKVNMVCKSAREGEGITFTRTDLEGAPFVRIGKEFLSSNDNRRSTLSMGAVQVQTIEHFLAALWALGIDNLKIELDAAELPSAGGSAISFFRSLKEAGIKELPASKEAIVITEEIRVEDEDRFIVCRPSDDFSIEYSIDYKVPCIKKETFELVLSGDSFEKEIASARTFCLKKEALFLFLLGLGRGATLKNTLVLGSKGPLGTKFRYPNEPVRHKVLDLVGDLYMLGRPIKGKIIANKSGHKLNSMLVKKIYEIYG